MGRRLAEALAAIALTLWVGTLWSVGGLVAPTLFATLEPRLAGTVAAPLFVKTAWVGLACGALFIICHASMQGRRWLRDAALWVVVAMLLAVAAGQFAVQPILESLRVQAAAAGQSVAAAPWHDRFAYWHAVAGLLFVGAGVLGLAAVTLVVRRPAARDQAA